MLSVFVEPERSSSVDHRSDHIEMTGWGELGASEKFDCVVHPETLSKRYDLAQLYDLPRGIITFAQQKIATPDHLY